MRGKRAIATSTWCSVATSVTPRSRAAPIERIDGHRGAGRIERRQRLVDQPQVRGRQQRARQPHALALAARQPVDARPQLVGEVEALERGMGVRDADRIDERAQAGPQRLPRQPRRQQRSDGALARRQRRRLRRQEQPPAQALQAGHRQRPGILAVERQAARRRAAARRRSHAAASSCRRPTARSRRPARRPRRSSVSAESAAGALRAAAGWRAASAVRSMRRPVLT